MVLTLDVGNSLIKVGVWSGERLMFVARLHTDKKKTREEYAITLLDVFRLRGFDHNQLDGAIIASVVPAISRRMQEAVRLAIGRKEVCVVSPGLKTGLNIKIDNPAVLGADLVCAATAALHRNDLPCIVISLGTANAIFALDEEGSFLGCSVNAGIDISVEALSLRTAQLPHISLDEPGNILGTNSVDSIKSGAIYGTAAMLDGMIERIRRTLGQDAAAIACGGMAKHIVKHCSTEITIDEHMILKGLQIIYNKNIRKAVRSS